MDDSTPLKPTLESLVANEELARRPARPPDFEGENRALVSLAERMATAPKDALEHLVQIALELCCAQSSGISLVEEENGRTVTGRGADTDTLVASAYAYVNALNKLLVKRRKQVPEDLNVAK